MDLDAVAVELDLMKPLLALRRFGLQRGKLGLNEARHLDNLWQQRNSQKARGKAGIFAQFSRISNNQGTCSFLLPPAPRGQNYGNNRTSEPFPGNLTPQAVVATSDVAKLVPSEMLGTSQNPEGFVVMEIQPEKEERTELIHSQIVAPQRESILTAVEIQPEKEVASRGIKFRAVESLVRTLLVRISIGRIEEDNIVRDSIRRIGAADPANVQMIASAQLELIAGYHQIALAQSRRIFFWALVGSGVGLIFLLAAVAHAFPTEIAFLSGAIVEIVAGIVFVLYGKTIPQLNTFQRRLDDLQRYILANCLCEALDGDERNKARVALIQEITRS